MRRAVLRVSLLAAAAMAATTAGTGLASAAGVHPNYSYWTEVAQYRGWNGYQLCTSRGQADVADPNNSAFAYQCNSFEWEFSPGIWRTGWELDEEFDVN